MNRRERNREKEHKAYYHSPIGIIEIVGKGQRLSSVTFSRKKTPEEGGVPSSLKECMRQLDEYFQGKRRKFSLKADLRGSDFQMRVWRALLGIPFGRTASYRDIAKAAGNVRAVRAVGNANRVNRFAILIPCHRVIGSDGSLVGYGGGLWRKKWLIAHEKRFARGKDSR